jgi:anti-sigma B factor antagonist
MNIDIRESGGVKVLAFEGNLDTNTSPEAEAKINALIDGGDSKLLVNFEQLNFISSAGLRVLLATAKKLGPAGGTLRICGLNPTVQEVFDISGFGTILSVKETEDEALLSF